MEKLGEILSRLMTQEGYARRGRQGPVFDRWGEVVGDLLSQKSWPVSVRKGVLLVQVLGSVWMHELQMQKYQILERLWTLVGEEEIKDIRWTVHGTVPRARRRGKGSPGRAQPSRPLTEEEAAWVHAVATQVEDSDLQKTLKRVLGKYLRSARKE